MWSAGLALEGQSPVKLLQRHVAQIASATCVCYAGSQHESVPYQTKRTGVACASFGKPFTCFQFTPSILERIAAQKASEHVRADSG